ncbi:ureidoglycolate lyase [Pararhizobium sp. IMCC21322]|uniref:ureidoglycolate lyase n=1 Tax=Pararhizobium sp. IMCC21322 TaxID=3067903 RepID=UPI0027407F35|nr:ureidoglycolate lyase [Pararhizobium sp. IMCC21322]
MSLTLQTQSLSQDAFAPFGDVLEIGDKPDMIINQGLCSRFHDLARIDIVGSDATAGISFFNSEARSLPYRLDMMERHPLGSQAFIPMTAHPFLTIVAPDTDGKPGTPLAFITTPGQGVNYHRNTWHGVLTPLSEPGLFAVVDRIGDGKNLEEHWFETPYVIADN